MAFLVGLNTGRDTMISHGTALSVVSDNIANTNTVGFKANRAEFSDLLAESIGGLYNTSGLTPGNGATCAIRTINTQGTIEMTNSQYDFAINGNGYFIIQDPQNGMVYTRAGNFTTDSEGYLVNNLGQYILGYEPGGATLTPLRVSGLTIEPTPSSLVNIALNLNSETGIVNGLPTQPVTYEELASDSSYKTYATIVDSLGKKQSVNLYFFKTGNMEWEVQAYASDESLGGTTQEPVLLGSTTLTFPMQAGNSTNVLNIAPNWSGAGAAPLAIDFSGSHSFANASAVNSIYADGAVGGTMESISCKENGEIWGYLNTGGSKLIAELAIATFTNPESLHRIGENKYIPGTSTSAVTIGRAQTNGAGSIKGAALEVSTVDMAGQFVDLIRFQRGYQAGSKIVTTLSELIHTTLQVL